MLLVNDDEAEIFKRRKKGAAGADHHVEVATPDVPPLVEPLSCRLPAVYQGDPSLEPGVYPLEGLGRECDLWHQQHSPAAQADGVGDGPEVNLGLAAAGHPVEEEGPFRERSWRCIPTSAE